MSTNIKSYFVSDLHFHHASILYFHPKRMELAGITIEELKNNKELALKKHDEWLISLWNSTVRKQDYVYILGDFCLGNKNVTENILKRLNGKKFLIRGNHDKSCNGLENYFVWVGDLKELKFTHNQYDFVDENETFCAECCHFPLLTWNRRPHGTVCVHGHTHGTLDGYNESSLELRVDVGLDGKLCNYGLVDFETLYNYFKSKKDKAGVKTFQDYNEWLMSNQGFRM